MAHTLCEAAESVCTDFHMVLIYLLLDKIHLIILEDVYHLQDLGKMGRGLVLTFCIDTIHGDV